METNRIPAVAIGGISAKNAAELLEGSQTTHDCLEGLAIVSAIMAAEDPKKTCEELKEIIQRSFKTTGIVHDYTVEKTLDFAVKKAKDIRSLNPMVHHITSKFERVIYLKRESYLN